MGLSKTPVNGWAVSRRKTAVIVGILFFVQMITAGIGTSLIQAFVNGNQNKAPLTLGVLLMLCSGLAVTAIGLLMYPVLKQVNQRLAIWYPIMRVTELAVSTAAGIYLLSQLQVFPNYLLWVYIPTGIGGVILTYLLFISKLVPRPIAVLGFVGYCALLLGVPLTLIGTLDISKGAGQILLAPGGLFEFLLLPIWLIAKGFHAPDSSSQTPLPPVLREAVVPS